MSLQSSLAQDPAVADVLPSHFRWGFASAAYQIEGSRDSRGDCPWDVLLKGKDNGNLCADSYKLVEEDIKLLKSYGATAYRFSISWCRVIPNGGENDPVNEEGLSYYKHLVGRLVEEGITPWITIFHWDTPITLHKRYCGWKDTPQFYRDFLRFCRLCFTEFGDKCKDWMTINEVSQYSTLGLHNDRAKINKPHIWVKWNSDGLDPDWDRNSDPWKLGRVILLAHAKAVDLYRREFQSQQGGRIGAVLNAEWHEPFDDSSEAKACAERARACQLGWFADPIFLGKVNETLRDRVGPDFPGFTDDEMALIKGSSDFFGMNHYGTSYATGRDVDPETTDALSFLQGCIERVWTDQNGKEIGIRGQNGHPYIVPWGFRKLLQHMHTKYLKGTGIPIVIGENGFPVEDEASMPLKEIVNDVNRQKYFAGYVKELVEAVRDDGILIDAYMAWSLVDNLEWAFGFYPRFGVTHIDRQNGCKRTPKNSAKLLKAMFTHAVAK
ncbi:hypothetical protein IAT40_005837 [Kwoniella sp. CBS 6097]